jgi:hypothetical protein
MIEPKVGEIYVHKLHTDREYEVREIKTHMALLRMTDGVEFHTSIAAMAHHLHLKVENTFKREYNTCLHSNVQSDRFFSAKIYKTCKDCGANLN